MKVCNITVLLLHATLSEEGHKDKKEAQLVMTLYRSFSSAIEVVKVRAMINVARVPDVGNGGYLGDCGRQLITCHVQSHSELALT